MTELNKLYMTNEALWDKDYSDYGFEWLDCHSEGKCLYAILRKGKSDNLVAVFNMGDRPQKDYRFIIPGKFKMEVLLYTDWEKFGGNTAIGSEKIVVNKNEVIVDLNAFSGAIVKIK